ncbi:MAG: hypothetical protein JRI23_07510 [Deltaproteobacteria bacterium]|jgi:hypothetical protein|nr:hypothetical protein [Deltaproteobacteria bacterium]MBW2531440.1 hypothetical protein [Deltaproteobacteria bacterium]
MRIALATCEDLPTWEVDDLPLHRALVARGAQLALPAWSDSTVDWAAFDVCLIRTTWDYQERREEFLAWTRQVAAVTCLLNPPHVVEWNTHKSYLADLNDRGVSTLPTVWLRPGAAPPVAGVMSRRGWTRGFLKPAIGATARETLRFDISEEGLAAAQAHADRLLAAGEQLLLQPYCDAVESHGEVSAIFIEGRLSHGVRKIPVAGDYRVQDDFGASDEPHCFDDDELALAEQALAAVGERLLYGRCDMLRDEQRRPRLTELELVEPSLFFRHAPLAADQLADALLLRLAPSDPG